MPVLLEQQELIDIAVGVGIFSASLVMVGGIFSWTADEAEGRTSRPEPILHLK